MQIYGPSNIHGPQGLQGPHWNRPAAPTATPQAVDQLDISAAAEAAASAGEAGDVRTDLVARVRSEIAAGTYETPGKIASAVDRMFDELA